MCNTDLKGKKRGMKEKKFAFFFFTQFRDHNGRLSHPQQRPLRRFIVYWIHFRKGNKNSIRLRSLSVLLSFRVTAGSIGLSRHTNVK